MTLEGKDGAVIADELGIKVESVYVLRARVKVQFVTEIRNLIEELEL